MKLLAIFALVIIGTVVGTILFSAEFNWHEISDDPKEFLGQWAKHGVPAVGTIVVGIVVGVYLSAIYHALAKNLINEYRGVVDTPDYLLDKKTRGDLRHALFLIVMAPVLYYINRLWGPVPIYTLAVGLMIGGVLAFIDEITEYRL